MNYQLFTIISFAIFLFSFPCASEIHKWIDSDGVVHFGENPPQQGSSNVVDVEVVQSSQMSKPAYEPINSSAQKTIKKKKIVMYATSWCSYCQKARDYFKANNLRYTEYDVELNPSKMKAFKRLGGTGYPLIIIGKDQKMNGFSASGFERRYYDKETEK